MKPLLIVKLSSKQAYRLLRIFVAEKTLFTPTGRTQFLNAIASIHRNKRSAAAAFRRQA
jgi:hypothetical protein